jgi:hypothetical protein
MPRHHQVTTCRKSGGPVSKHCSCEHCTLSVCSVCDAGEGGLTTDCPGSKIAFDKQQEIYETSLDYTDDRGWHLAEPMMRRSPRFESTKLPPEPPHVDLRATIAPSIDWGTVDRNASLQHELAQKAIAWVLADRIADDHSATLTRLEDEVDAQLPRKEAIDAITDKVDLSQPDEQTRELLGKLEYEKIEFHLASRRAEKCDEEFRQAARKLVTALESGHVPAHDEMLFKRTCGCTVVAGTACPHFVAPVALKEAPPKSSQEQ